MSEKSDDITPQSREFYRRLYGGEHKLPSPPPHHKNDCKILRLWGAKSLLGNADCKTFYSLRSQYHYGLTDRRPKTLRTLQLSYSDLVIKLMNSEGIYLNLRLTNYISLLNNLRDSILSSKNDVT